MLDQLARIARLYDFYGPLLTAKQRHWLELYYHNDLSLGEIAKEERVSRQAVYEGLQRAVRALEEYEFRLGYLKRDIATRRQLQKAIDYLERYNKEGRGTELEKVRSILCKLLEQPEGSL